MQHSQEVMATDLYDGILMLAVLYSSFNSP